MVNYRKLYTTRLASLASIFLACAIEVAGIADAQGFPARNLAEAEGAVGKLSGDMAIGRFDLDQAELLDYIRHVIPKHPRLPTLQNQACRGIRAYHSTMETDDPMIGGILHAIALCAYLEGDLKKAVQLLEAAKRSEDAYISVASADEFAARGSLCPQDNSRTPDQVRAGTWARTTYAPAHCSVFGLPGTAAIATRLP